MADDKQDVQTECLHKLSEMWWQLQAIDRRLEDLSHLMHQVFTLSKDTQAEIDELMRFDARSDAS